MSKRAWTAVLGALLVGLLLSYLLQRLGFTPPQNSTGQGAPARRVICMSPSVTETVFALGQGDRVVGISQYTTYPPEALKKPQCGGFFNPNFELLLALKPDLVITQGKAEKVSEFCRDHGIRHASLITSDLTSVFEAIRQAGMVLGCDQDAERLCAKMRGQLDVVRERVAHRPKQRVFLLVGREPGALKNLLTVGGGSFLDDVLEAAGGENIYRDLTILYPTVSKESLVQRQPDVVIELHGEGLLPQAKMADIIETWQAMPALRAVQKKRIHAIGSTYALIPGPRVVLLAETFADILHPPEE